MYFRDRREGGRQLARHLAAYANRPDVLVLALPRGGVPVAYEVARALNAPLDVYMVRKLGLPGHEELAMGAVASGGVRVLNRDVVEQLDIPEHVIDAVARKELQELERRERMYRGDRPFPDVRGKTVILVDDGLATGSTMRAAARALRSSVLPAWSSRCQPPRARRATHSATKLTTSCAPSHPIRFTPSACGMTTSPKRLTRKCASSWPPRKLPLPLAEGALAQAENARQVASQNQLLRLRAQALTTDRLDCQV